MKYLDYKEQVKRTLPDMGEFNSNRLILNSVHMVLGMFSEVYELKEAYIKKDIVNIAEEITDIAWYASNYCNIRGIETLHILTNTITYSSYNIDSALRELVTSISELQDYDKKEFAYNKVETEEIKNKRAYLMNNIISLLSVLYYLSSIDSEQAMQNNIDKLRKRFPDKFNNYDATNRNLEIERKELEK